MGEPLIGDSRVAEAEITERQLRKMVEPAAGDVGSRKAQPCEAVGVPEMGQALVGALRVDDLQRIHMSEAADRFQTLVGEVRVFEDEEPRVGEDKDRLLDIPAALN